MKKEIISEKNDNSLHSKITVKEKTPEDGFVFENKEHLATTWSETTHPPRSVWHKGYSKKSVIQLMTLELQDHLHIQCVEYF